MHRTLKSLASRTSHHFSGCTVGYVRSLSAENEKLRGGRLQYRIGAFSGWTEPAGENKMTLSATSRQRQSKQDFWTVQEKSTTKNDP